MKAELWQVLGALGPLAGAYLGAVLASFVNVICYREPLIANRRMTQMAAEVLAIDQAVQLDGEDQHLTLFQPGSHCPHCKAPIRWYHLVPVLSYLLLGGKCRSCRASIPVRYFLIEVIGTAFGLVCGLRFGFSLELVVFIAGMTCLLALAVMDFDHGYVSEREAFILLWLGLVASAMYVPHLPPPDYAIMGAALGYLFMRVLRFVASRVARVYRQGDGDELVLAAIGAWAGPMQLVVVVLVAWAAQTLILSILFLRNGDNRNSHGMLPYLAIAATVVIALKPDVFSTGIMARLVA
ncbi:MAG TPA: prepilin peptidase [Nevskia sp.]|nr:prepilin peptidase [Nevskia sp.]